MNSTRSTMNSMKNQRTTPRRNSTMNPTKSSTRLLLLLRSLEQHRHMPTRRGHQESVVNSNACLRSYTVAREK